MVFPFKSVVATAHQMRLQKLFICWATTSRGVFPMLAMNSTTYIGECVVFPPNIKCTPTMCIYAMLDLCFVRDIVAWHARALYYHIICIYIHSRRNITEQHHKAPRRIGSESELSCPQLVASSGCFYTFGPSSSAKRVRIAAPSLKRNPRAHYRAQRRDCRLPFRRDY